MKNKKCKNCEQPLNGGYCSNCGQRDIELLKFKKLIKDFFDHHLDLDSRIFRTIKYLMFRPGFLTIEYWNGRRARYVPPFKIYLLTSFLYFMVLSLNTNNQVVENDIVETKIEKNPTIKPLVIPPPIKATVTSIADSGGYKISTMFPWILEIIKEELVFANEFCIICIAINPGTKKIVNL